MASSSDGDRPWQSYHTVYTNAKAGMEGVDKEKVQRIIYEMSKGSKYFENEKRKEVFINQKIEKLRAQYAMLTDKDMSHFQMVAGKRSLEMEVSRDLSKIWLHVDMDAFYAAVETLENPLLNGKPLAVGSMSMICTANYEARKFGVRAAMPGFIARKLCPDLIIVPTNFEKYTHYSELTRKVFRNYDTDYIATSLDEAYLNMTDHCCQRHISSEEVAAELRNAIYEETGLTCSVGMAANRMLAKVCSDINKPNGQYILPNDRRAIMAFVSSLPVRKIGGIGKVTEHILKDVLGITTCEEIVKKGAFLYALFSQCSSVGLGLGGTETPKQRQRKSISSERTFPATDDELLLFQKLADIAETLSNDMQKECLVGRTLTLKLKTATFEVRTRAVSLHKYINSKEDILSSASKLLRAELPLALRLMGLRMSQFHDDRNGSVERTQRTLMSFLTKEDANISFSKSACPDISDKQLILDQESFSFDNTTLFSNNGDYSLDLESSDLLEPNHLALLENDDITSHVDVRDRLNVHPSKESGRIEEVGDISFDHKEIPSSNQGVDPFWINDYICSVCGIELPPSFIVERQEHSDYHFAEKLQKESMQSIGNFTEGRAAAKSMQSKDCSRNKRKSTQKEGIHIPIDAFFIKGKKNLHAEK